MVRSPFPEFKLIAITVAVSLLGLCFCFLVSVDSMVMAFVPTYNVIVAASPPTSFSTSSSFLLRQGGQGIQRGQPGHGVTKKNSRVVLMVSPSSFDPGMIQEVESARAAFVLCFFGAIGSAAVGREVIPVTWREYQKLNALVGKGTATVDGTELELIGYPEPVYKEDILAIINIDHPRHHNMTIQDIVDTYPIPNQIPGMLRFESLAQANAHISQVAVRAVFDSMAIGMNKNSVAPQVAIQKFAQYNNHNNYGGGDGTSGLDVMKSNSQLSKTIGVTALLFLLSLIGTADYFALYHFIHGWFPEWSGTSQLPGSLVDFQNLVHLPDYFMNDVPTAATATTTIVETTTAFPMD